MIDPIAKFLGALSVVGGAVATAVAATTAKPPPVLLVGFIAPQDAAEWVPVIANAIPAIGGACLLLYANWRQTRRKADADDAKTILEAMQAKLDKAMEAVSALTAERDGLLAEREKPEPEPEAE